MSACGNSAIKTFKDLSLRKLGSEKVFFKIHTMVLAFPFQEQGYLFAFMLS